ncbi:hypothetical protein [Nonomuraea sp. NPDC046570]|uniref:hypothetical protein n=1 Tax=Nonomuraea sp. NPDC046570 TaxID=3155255 RepID=UPI0033D1FD02
MTHSNDEAPPARKGWSRPPLWLRLLAFPVALLASLAVAGERGLVMGLAAGTLYGLQATSLLIWDRMVAWSDAHPYLDDLVILPILFFTLATFTDMPLLYCALASLIGTPLVFLRGYLTRRSTPAS